MPAAALDEIEAKLLAPDRETLRRIAALTTIGQFRIEAGRTAHLRTCYLDTADRRLLEKRIALRVRNDPASPQAWEMTAKWAGSVDHDVHARRELTVSLDTPRIPAVLPPGPLRDELAGTVGERALEILVVTEIDRRTALIRDARDAAVAELALDTVQHSAPASPKSCDPYYEVEVERIGGGSPAVVAEIAHLLRKDFPLRPTADTKFSRAMRDLHGLAFH